MGASRPRWTPRVSVIQQQVIGTDLTQLESLLLQELGWSQSKVEELLLPIIQKIQKRNQVGLSVVPCTLWKKKIDVF